MSGAENEAVRSEAIEAGGRAIGEAAAASNYEADWLDMAAAAYDAMRPIIAREVLAGVCKREGHDEAEITTYADLGNVRRFVCARCSARRSEPYDKWANAEIPDKPRPATERSQAPGLVLREPTPQGRFAEPGQALPDDGSNPEPERATDGPARYAFAEPESGCFVPTARPGERSAELLKEAAKWMATVQFGPTYAEPYDLRDSGFTIGQRRAIPAPEPCPFDGCDTGPLGRDQLIAHIAQEHPDARSVQSVLGEDDPRSES